MSAFNHNLDSSQNAVQSYAYTPLSQDGLGQIRVFQIDNDLQDDCISGTFQVVNLTTETPSKTSYQWDAISYPWEDQVPTKNIAVDGQSLKVTPNVAQILENLRPQKRGIWIDGVCIDQANEQERSQQLPLMGEIYHRACTVIIFMGSQLQDQHFQAIYLAAQWLNKRSTQPLSYLPTLREAFTKAYPDLQFDSPFHNLGLCSWFRRIWVVQEAAIARSLIVRLGHLQISWNDFALTTMKFMSGMNAHKAFTTSLEESYAASLNKAYEKPTQKMLSMIYIVSQLRAWVQSADYPLAPSKLVFMCMEREASLRSDKIYALSGLFGLKHSSAMIPFPINYTLPATQVYKDFTVWCIQYENTLDIIAQKRNERGLSRNLMAGLPSWVTDWSNGEVGFQSSEMRPVALQSIQSRSIQRETPPMCKIAGSMLCLRGYVLDSVKGGFQISLNNSTHDETIARWQRGIPEDEKANLVLFGQKRPTVETLKSYLANTIENEFRSSHLWRDEPRPRRLADRSPEFRLGLLTQRGCVGIAFPFMDFDSSPKICALAGGRALFILQPVDSAFLGKVCYRLVCGDCFIEGFTDGRGIEMAQRLGLPEEICIV